MCHPFSGEGEKKGGHYRDTNSILPQGGSIQTVNAIGVPEGSCWQKRKNHAWKRIKAGGEKGGLGLGGGRVLFGAGVYGGGGE